MAHWQSVLRPGDWVHFDGGEHQVVALTGTSVRLCSSDGAQMVVLATHLMSAPDFGVIDAAPPPQMTPFGLLDTLPAPVLAAAREWERHIVEITTGVAPEGIARPEYDPAARTQIERDRAKAAELAAAGRPLGVRTLQRMRGRYAEQGLWGLVDQRVLRECEPTGRVDERVVAVVRQELDAQTDVSTGTRSRLIRRVRKSLEDTYGPGVVPLPGGLIDAADDGPRGWKSEIRSGGEGGGVGGSGDLLDDGEQCRVLVREGGMPQEPNTVAQAGQGNQLPARQHPSVLIDSPRHDPQLSAAMRRCLRRA